LNQWNLDNLLCTKKLRVDDKWTKNPHGKNKKEKDVKQELSVNLLSLFKKM